MLKSHPGSVTVAKRVSIPGKTSKKIKRLQEALKLDWLNDQSQSLIAVNGTSAQVGISVPDFFFIAFATAWVFIARFGVGFFTAFIAFGVWLVMSLRMRLASPSFWSMLVSELP